MSNELRTIPIYRAFSRPQLVMGCEREPILSAGLLSAVLIVSGSTLLTIILGVVLWLVCFSLLRKVAKSDPYMSKIYLKHIRYRPYYPPRATPFADSALWQRKTK